MAQAARCVLCEREAFGRARASERKEWEPVCVVCACGLPERYQIQIVSEVTIAEKKRASDRRWHAENREKVKEAVRRWRSANREKVLEYSRKSYAENREKVKAAARRRYAANPEKVKEAVRRWRSANREKDRDRRRKWSIANREKVNAAARRRYAANRENVKAAVSRWHAENPDLMGVCSRRYSSRKQKRAAEISGKETRQIQSPSDGALHKSRKRIVLLVGDEWMVSHWGVVLRTRIATAMRKRLLLWDWATWREALLAGSLGVEDVRLVISFVGSSGKVFQPDFECPNVLYVDPHSCWKDAILYSKRLVGPDVTAENLRDAVIQLTRPIGSGERRKRKETDTASEDS